MTMRVLVACEASQVVTKAFRSEGCEAYSCDVLPCTGERPEWHMQRDVRELLRDGGKQWDLVVAFPPCTHLAVSGARWFRRKRLDGRQEQGINFFRCFTELECVRVAIENPVGIMSTEWRKPDQIIQPWMFGHGETKATCLWLSGLPLLKRTNVVEGRSARVHRLPPTKDRSTLRGLTYPGVAKAMAKQWSGVGVGPDIGAIVL